MSISSYNPRNLSPQRPSSRASSIHSTRAHSPSLALDDPVAVRNHISTLKHSIRQQQAQVINLENIVLRGPRPYPQGMTTMPSHSPSSSTVDLTADSMSTSTPPPSSYSSPPSSYSHSHSNSTSHHSIQSTSSTTSSSSKIKRHSSFDKLHNMAPESSLPLPKRESTGIREGVPMDFGVASVAPGLGHHKRVSSPTRSYSRIPVSAVGNARALADEGTSPAPPLRASLSALAASSIVPPPLDISTANSNSTTSTLNSNSQSAPSSALPSSANSTSAAATPTANKRMSLTPGGTTKVLADLQAGVINARHALENTKAQLRVSQRSVAQLTRQTEDLKEGRERLRLENEGLNNVVARKERLLQEVLERARKAEAEAASLKTQLKSETTASKKSLREMELALSESTALSQKSEREYITLRDTLKSLTESWKHDTDRLRDEMTKREEKLRAEAEGMGKKYRRLVEELERDKASDGGKGERESVRRLREEDERVRKQLEEAFREEIGNLRKELDRVAGDGEEANQTAKTLALELARLRRMMQAAGRNSMIKSS